MSKSFAPAAIVAATLSIASLHAPAAAAESLRLLNAWPDNQTTVRVIAKAFVDKVEAAGISVSQLGPDAFPPLEQFEPLQQGLVDMVFTHPAYHGGLSPVGLTVDAIGADPAKVRSGGVFKLYDDHYAKLGIKVIAIAPLGKTGFRFVSRVPVDGKAHSFDGMKVRGNIAYLPVIEALGGSAVNMPGGEIYSALEKGVVDAAPWARTGIVDWKWQEVTKHVVQPDFGTLYNWLFMNRAKWDSLDAKDQKAVEAAAIHAEMVGLNEMEKLSVAELETLKQAGLTVTTMNDTEQANIERWWAEGLWGVGAKKEPETIAAIRAKAKSLGLTQ